MDHAHAWRSRPPMPPPPPFAAPSPPADICPVCSIPHFPFCPPPYPQTPGMPFHDQFFPRPPLPTTPPPPPQPQPPPPPPPPQAPYDPFVDHQPGPTMNPPRPWNVNPNPNPSFDRDLYGYSNPSFDYPHAGVKRMRIDESRAVPGSGRGSGWAPNLDNSHRVITEDERRLKLIREHGGANHKFEKPFEGIGGGRNGFEARSLNNYDTDNFQDPNYGNFDRKETVYSQDSYYNSKRFSEDRFLQQYVHGDRNVEPGRSNYGQVNGYGHTGNSADGYSNAEINIRNSEGMGYGSSMGDWQGVSGANAGYNNSKSGFSMGNRESSNLYTESYGMQQHGMELKAGHYGSPYVNEQGGSVNRGPSWVFNGQPPLPASPPPPLPVEPPGRQFAEPVVSTSPSGRSLFPIAVASSAPGVSSYPSIPEANTLPPTYYPNKAHLSAPGGFSSEGIQTTQPESAKRYLGEGEKFPTRHIASDKPKVVDASHLLKHPHRATRPDHIVIILRGLPGSGKSYLAKMLRDIEVENGGSAPRIHTMDDYFMTEVEKVEESEGSKPSGSIRVKKLQKKKVMEYCYEPEMEEAYRSSMLKAFKKTLDEGVFSFVIVDDRNLRVADFAQFWATAKRSGYEVYLLEATYKDPVGCAARNIHGFTQDDIQKMADQWEEAPSLYLKLDIKSLLHGDNLEDSGIQEVDMDTEDGDVIGASAGLDDRNPERVKAPPVEDLASNGPSKDQRWHVEADRQIEEVKELGKSKWSNDLDEDDIHKTEVSGRKLSSLSGLIQSYSKEGKTVRWGDQGEHKGFSIGAIAQTSSLVIGPGAGYNLKTNPLTDEDKLASRRNTGELKKQNVFQEKMRAERESFRAAFDKRRQRIGGLEVDDE